MRGKEWSLHTFPARRQSPDTSCVRRVPPVRMFEPQLQEACAPRCGGAGAPSPLRACPASPSRLTDPPRPHPHPRYVPIRPPPAPPCLCRCRNRAASRMMLTVARKVHAPQRTPPCTAPACGPPFAHAGEDEDKNQQKKCDCCDDRDVHRKSRGCAQQRTQVIQLITILCLFVRVCLCSCLCVAHRLL